MPPANSPTNDSSPSMQATALAHPLSGPATDPRQYSTRSPLSQLDSLAAGYGLAATLNDEYSDSRRTRVDPQDEWRAQNAAAAEENSRQRQQERTTAQIEQDRFRLQRVLSRLSQLHDLAYGDRIPAQNSLYDWSPSHGTEGDDEEELQEIIHELRQQQPNTHPEILRAVGRSQLDAEREQRSRPYSSRYHSNQSTQASESSLRSAAILQSVRRHPLFTAREREHIQRYMMDNRHLTDRERSGREAEERDRRNHGTTDPHRYEQTRFAWQSQRSGEAHNNRDREARTRMEARQVSGNEARNRSDSYRRGHAETTGTFVSPRLEQTIKYLSKLRSSHSYDDSLSYAVDAGFLNKEFFGDNHEDFVLDPNVLPRPTRTSWLVPGAVFSGSQHATTPLPPVSSNSTSTPGTTLYRFRNNDTLTSTTFDTSRPWVSYSPNSWYNQGQSSRRFPSYANLSSQSYQDTWPVKVTIHAVDFESMTLSATMEAYDVPSHPPNYAGILQNANTATSLSTASSPFSQSSRSSQSPALQTAQSISAQRTSSITTYLEGEILDFSTYTLQTESFKSTPLNDATYWRKLLPFAHLSDEDLVRALLSTRFLHQLGQKWILMRWKERCFVKPQRSHNTSGSVWNDQEEMASEGCGLTISGFYYVCLRREDGMIEGLYYDPQSSPYQHLRLGRVARGLFPAFEFR